MSDMEGSCQNQDQRETLPVLTIGQPYPPCILPTSDLQPMKMSELSVETHHRGYKLIVKRAAGVRGQGLSPVVQLATRSWTLVEELDGDGDAERLEVCLHTHQHGRNMLEYLGRGVLVVREPYLTVTEHGEATLRVDHPSDLECRDYEAETSARELENSHEDMEAAVRKARRCKEQGNAALTARDLPLAHAHYTRGLSLSTRHHKGKPHYDHKQLDTVFRDLYRNRAHINLLLNRLDSAKTDALSSLAGGSASDIESLALDSKAYYRAGCAAYNLGEYEEARALFSQHLRLKPEAGEAVIIKTEQRIRERDTGLYDLPMMRAVTALSRSQKIDAASFVNRTRLGDSPGRGRGLFAACDMPTGGLVLCEKAFCVAWGEGKRSPAVAMTYDVRDDRIRLSPVGLVKTVVEKLRGTPSYIEEVLELYGDYRGHDDDAIHSESWLGHDNAVIDVFRVHDIVSRNAFGLGPSVRTVENPRAEAGGTATGLSAGLWTKAARINHSCVPNTDKEFIGDMILIRAKRPIAAGEELLLSYIDETSSYRARQEALACTWGFECHCGLCKRYQGR
jgi:tetratricopeptide (TPR) repeat protein